MGVLPPGGSLDPAAVKRLLELDKLISRATYQLKRLETELYNGPATARYVKARLTEANEIRANLLDVRKGQASGEVMQWAEEHFPATYRTGAGQAVRDLKVQGINPIKGDTRIHTHALSSIASNYGNAVGTMSMKIGTNIATAATILLKDTAFADQIAAGVISGLPRSKVSRMLKNEMRRTIRATSAGAMLSETALSKINMGGRNYDLDYWAEMHARTESARAATGGTRSMCQANGVEHIIITEHSHDPCICTPFEGLIFRLDRNTESKYPWIGEVPNGGCPMHPNCVHREAPAVLKFLEARNDVEGRDTIHPDFQGLDQRELARRVRANKVALAKHSKKRAGHMPADLRINRVAPAQRAFDKSTIDLSAENLIRIKEEEIMLLPLEEAIVFDSDGNEVFRKRGDENSVAFTKEEVAQFKDRVFTHNHPELGSLSSADLSLAVKADVAEMRAIDIDGNLYSLKRPPNGWGNVDPEEMSWLWRDGSAAGQERFLDDLIDGKLSRVDAKMKMQEEQWSYITNKLSEQGAPAIYSRTRPFDL
jgi:hypothetical protein